MSTNVILDAALAYAGRGWPVFRLSGSKVPLRGTHGHLDATTDAAVIEEWFAGPRGARLCVGLATGDLVVLDADGPGGLAELTEMARPHGGLPRTLVAQTSRGFHFYYRKPTGAGDLRTLNGPRAAKGDDGLDIKAGGGYVVLPPSVNRKTGFVYRWVEPQEPVCDLPAWLVDWLVARGGRRERQQVAPVAAFGPRPAWLPAGGEADAVAWRALTLARGDLPPLDWVLSRLKRIPASIEILKWFEVGCCIHDWDSGPIGLAIFKAWSKTSRRHEWSEAEPRCETEWRNMAKPKPGIEKVTVWGLDRLAEHHAPTTVDTSVEGDFSKQTNGFHSDFATEAGGTAPICFPDREKGGKPKATCRNARAAIRGLRMVCEHDTFHNKMLLGGQIIDQWAGELSDDATQMLRVVIERHYGFDPGLQNAHDAAVQECLQRAFDPVCDYLGELKWDGTSRVATWLSVYMGAVDTPLCRAIGTLALVAAVRRVRVPGTKFDQIIVLESPEGRGKSSAIEILAGPENFSDQLILTLDDKGQQEAVQGVWLYEIGDLAGMGRADVERVKAFASRKVDRARPAYGRTRVDRARRCVFFATTNDDTYLLSQTGNRRFWPVRVGTIALADLARDRDQLWAEAVAIERSGISLVLPERLWGEAASEQETRLVHDVWLDMLGQVTGSESKDVPGEWRVMTRELFSHHLGISADRASVPMSKRLGSTMRRLGWQGPKQFKQLDGSVARGYWRTK